MSAPAIGPFVPPRTAIEEIHNWIIDLDTRLTEIENAIGQVPEIQRQQRIAQGIEHACASCGCSESRSCEPYPCVWVTEKLCSRCVKSTGKEVSR